MKLTKEQLKKIILSEIQAYQVHESEEEPEEEPQLSPKHSEFLHEITQAIMEMFFVIEKVNEIMEDYNIEPSDIYPDDTFMPIDIDKEVTSLRRASRKFMRVMDKEYKLGLKDSGIEFYHDI